jgi:outer membrane protein insertion porin family
MFLQTHDRPRRLVTRFKLSLCALFLLLVCAQALPAQDQPHGSAGKKMHLSKIEFVGLQTHTEAEAIAASGLQVGQMVDVPALDEAAQRLLDSGLVKKLSYRYRTAGDQATVTFQVEEERSAAIPVVFENFVWFTDEELQAAVRQQVPDFNGSAPDSAVDGITKALQRLLQERKIQGRVEYLPSENAGGGDAKHTFSVEGVTLPICSLHFAGASAVSESELLKSSKELMGGDYRRVFVLSYASVNLIPIYRERGHLRASFGTPQAKPQANGDCRNGVAVTVPVEEGLSYNWDHVEWANNSAFNAQELSTLLGMKPGELANGLKIDRGLAALQTAYGHKGYLGLRLKPTPDFADATQRVAYRIDLTEGPQYHMGELTISGLPESIARQLRSSWKLKPGDIYDASYLDEFMKKGISLRSASDIAALPKGTSIDIKPDRQKLTVDVSINFK